MNILLTGGTGFLGYHIAQCCVRKGHQVFGLRRPASRSLFSAATERNVHWITMQQNTEWEERVRLVAPEVLIHAAWGGVAADGRNNAALQQENIVMTEAMMRLAPFRQIIMLGSQDEYGMISSKVDENQPLRPLSEYAKAKIACQQRLQAYAEEKNIEWQWVRIFSVYGPKQGSGWLIPSLIEKCRSGVAEMETTPGEQQYSYLYAEDFAEAVCSMVGKEGKSGIYNLSSDTSVKLRDLFNLVKELTHSSIVFRPVLPYREHQSMLILGNAEKLIQTFGPFEHTSLRQGLLSMIKDKDEQK